jgi:ABC-type nitrate/sulfonate/bicarbonate transport system permease component
MKNFLYNYLLPCLFVFTLLILPFLYLNEKPENYADSLKEYISNMDVFYSFYKTFTILAYSTCIVLISMYLIIFVNIFNDFFVTFIFNCCALLGPIPKLALYPLLLMILGIDDTPKIIVGFFSIFVIVFNDVFRSIKKLESSALMDIIFIYQKKSVTGLFLFYFKGTLLSMAESLRVGLMYGLVTIIGSEFIMSRHGIGVFIWKCWESYDIPKLLFTLILLSILSILISSIWPSRAWTKLKRYSL